VAEEPAKDITRLLHAWSQGDDGALASLMPLVYDELHRSAHFHMAGEAPDNTLQTTALVNEAYVRLIDWKSGWSLVVARELGQALPKRSKV